VGPANDVDALESALMIRVGPGAIRVMALITADRIDELTEDRCVDHGEAGYDSY